MGFLDDAIREHLDLKRRRGADPTEIERAEREALGPVRRDPFDDAHDEPEAEVSGGAPAGAYDHAADSEYEEYEADGEDWGDAFEEEPPAHEPRPEPLTGSEQEFPAGEPHPAEESFVEEPYAQGPSPAPHSGEVGAGDTGVEDIAAGDETEEYDVEGTFAEEHPAAPGEHAHATEPPAHEEHEPGDEDVLEETPEFLQDAPEHDRLWFEQRPPRDFDFDG